MIDRRVELVAEFEAQERDEGPFASGFYGQLAADTTRTCMAVNPAGCRVCEGLAEMMLDEQ